MSVHYKFKSALDFDTITFDGLHISVNDLKKAIIHQKRLGKTTDFDLQITNAQTKEEYVENSTLIPKNTSLIIARIPIAVQVKKPWDPQAEKVHSQRTVSEPERGELDLSQMNGSEEEKIQVMIIQSTMDYDPNKYHKLKGQGQTGEVPATYRCFKCHKPGHWIKNCPLNVSGDYDHKRNTGIPKSFLQERVGQQKTEDTFAQLPVAEKKQEIPEDLICSICKDLFTDAVMIPCCGSSFCDECVRTALLESEDNECPDCKEKGSSPGSLIPNRFLRNSVNAFKNETGYNKIQKRKVAEIVKPTEVPIQTHVRNNGSQKSKINVVNEENIYPSEITPNKENIIQEKKIDAYSSSHEENESDFEDNITVTVPPPLVPGHRSSFQENFFISRNIKNPRPPGMEHSPRQNLQLSPPQETNVNNSNLQEISVTGPVDKMEHYPNHHASPNITIQRGTTILVHRSTPNEIYGNAPPITSYNQNIPGPIHGLPTIRTYHTHNYGVHNSAYSQYNMGERMRGVYPIRNMGFHNTMNQIRPRYMLPSTNIDSVYQGIGTNVGTGIIDDPLEAFNRIMREKEKRKEERRRSPERRRSRSSDGRSSRARPLPRQHLKLRQRSPQNDRRENSPPMRDRRDRSRNRDKRNSEIDKWKRGSSSMSDRSSRSRSWSNIPRRWSKSPLNVRKRSRSRSPLFSPSRSPSRSISTGRFRGPMVPSMRYNSSPLRSISPRYRSKDTRNRRDEFKEDSPRGMRKGRSKGRSVENQSNRQDRFIGGPQHHGKYDLQPEYSNDRRLPRNYFKRYSRERQIDSKYNNQYSQEKNMNFKPLERYDNAPPGNEEPPPPGFEISPQLEFNSGNRNNFDDIDSYRNEYRKLNTENKKNYRGNPSSKSTQNRDCAGEYNEISRHTKEGRHRDGRSWSQNSIRSCNTNTNKSVLESKRRSRSRSVSRSEKFQENMDFYVENEHQKHRNPTADNYYYGNDEQLTNKIGNDGKKCDKIIDRGLEKKAKTNYAKEEKNNISDRKMEKVGKYIRQKEKEREKEKEKEKDKNIRKITESDKCKNIQEIDEDKKDKKIKERKKKKKDKDEKEAKKKIKKKEKKEKDKIKVKDSKDLSAVVNLSTVQEATGSMIIENAEEVNITQPEIKELSTLVKEEDKKSESNKEGIDLNLINLYSDICRDEDIKYDYVKETPNESSGIIDTEKNIYSGFDVNLDLDELNSSNFAAKKTADSILVPLPEISKWEKWEVDEDGQNDTDEIKTDAEDRNSNITVDKCGKVTGEVLKRAENAIFKRAINAIRPAIEIKTISVDRQKLYSNENINEISPSPISHANKNEEITQQNLQITLPVRSPSNDLSGETKSEKFGKNTIPTKSVKDRLGPILNKKAIPASVKKSTNFNNDIKNHNRRNKSGDRNTGRVNQRRSEVMHQNRNNEREKFAKYKNSRNEFQQNNEFQNRRQRYPEHSRDRNTHLDSGSRKVYDTYKYEKQRPRGPDKNIGGLKRRSNSRDNKKKDNKSNKEIHNKRQRTESNSFENREKRIKQLGEENSSLRENKSAFNTKKNYISENNPTEVKDQPRMKEKKYNTNGETDLNATDAYKIDTNFKVNDKQRDRNSKTPVHPKNSNSTSGGLTSSSSGSGSDSGSESEGRKNKRKHKKEKKRTKRFSSTESNNSNTKRKISKNKKKNKTSKKKKNKK